MTLLAYIRACTFSHTHVKKKKKRKKKEKKVKLKERKNRQERKFLVMARNDTATMLDSILFPVLCTSGFSTSFSSQGRWRSHIWKGGQINERTKGGWGCKIRSWLIPITYLRTLTCFIKWTYKKQICYARF